MLLTKLVVRVLDESEQLLGWAEVIGQARGDGKIWVERATEIVIETSGVPHYLSVHWCDVNVETRSVIESAFVKVGNSLHIPADWSAIICGPAAGGLPAVTVRSPITIGVPVGSFSGVGNR